MDYNLTMYRMAKLFLGLSIILMTSCGVTSEITGTIVQDCSGTYIRHNNVDWKICNDEKILPKDKTSIVRLNYRDVYQCKDSSTCLVYHPSSKSIHVKKVLRQ